MSDIIAHIVFDDSNNLKLIEIVDNVSSNIVTTNLEQTIYSGQKDFYIKISVKQCANSSMDCFSLSNGSMYRLDFDTEDENSNLHRFKSHIVSSLQNSIQPENLIQPENSIQPENLIQPENSIQPPENSNLHRFKSVLAEKLNVPIKVGLEEFKKRIVQAL